MDKERFKRFIKEIKLFVDFTEEDFEKLAECGDYYKLQKGEFLFTENNERRFIHVILEGQVELFKTTAYGKENRIANFGKYDFLGEGCIIDDSPHTTSARALIESETFRIGKQQLKNLLKKDGEIAVKFYTKVSQVIFRRMSYTNTRLFNPKYQHISGRTRTEHDLLGDRDIPNEFYYGIQTMRGRENFNITGVTINFYPTLVEAFAMVKKAAAKANFDLGLLSENVTKAIEAACDQIITGHFHQDFVVDMIQGGAGTSTNMNANEVIANVALEIMGKQKGDYIHCHPNNHVNLSQSTNDAYPTAVKIALYNSSKSLIDILKSLIESFRNKAIEFNSIIKMGRTQLQDAVPMTMGQEFEAYAVTLNDEVKRIERNAKVMLHVNMGATAIGTGINSEPGYKEKVIQHLQEVTGLEIALAENLVEATQDTSSFMMFASSLKQLAIKLSKISNDLRLLSSGPRCGFNEINLPPMQPGSSIMPGKVNPVIPEVMNQICFKVIGNDITISLASEAGQLELNVMEPVIVQSLFESLEMLKNGMSVLRFKCIDGITANAEHTRKMVQNSIGIVTALNPIIGYEASTQIAKEALETGKGVYELVLQHNLLSKKQLDEILSPENMLSPQEFAKK